MYAVVGRWNMDQSRTENQDRKLHDVIVPMVEVAPDAPMDVKAPSSGHGLGALKLGGSAASTR
jgi:hypothetical protein